MRTTTAFLPVALLATLGACGGKDNTSDTSPTTGNPNGGTNGGTAGGTVSTDGWSMELTAIDFAAQAPAAEGLCIELLDPSPALTGGVPEVLKSSTVGPNGAVVFENIHTTSVLGLLMSVKDCTTLNTTVFTSATGVPYPAIRYLAEGDTLSGLTAYVLSMDFTNGLQASMAAAGSTGDIVTDGTLFGFVLDSAGTPLSGATVTCEDCPTTYYLDPDDADGLVQQAGVTNTSTTAYGVWIVPAGPVGQYTAEDGGAHTFEQQISGSSAGSALITAFYAN